MSAKKSKKENINYIHYMDQDYEDIKLECTANRTLFEDPHFPLYLPQEVLSANPQIIGSIEWRRPPEFIANPVFHDGVIDRFDIDQGGLGDCWFIAATADFAGRPKKFFEKCILLDQTFDQGYCGIFRFRFWRFGDWVEVVVDDRLCVLKDGTSIFAHNKSNPREQWPALVEKAYAKLHGGYGGIVGGYIQNALIDYTGGISERIDLTDISITPDEIFDTLKTTLTMHSMLGCSISSQPANLEDKLDNGIYLGHCYSITAIKTITDISNQNHNLIRLRNPWGYGEYNGPWSDKSPEWNSVSESEKRKINYKSSNTDGEFWMDFNDWLTIFKVCQMCHLTPDAFTSEIINDQEQDKWKLSSFDNAWTKNRSAGGAGTPNIELLWTNPQYYFYTTSKCQVIISLMHKYWRRDMSIALGYKIIKLQPEFNGKFITHENSGQAIEKVFESGTYIALREICKRFELPEGNYILLPTTYYPNEEAHYLLRIFSVEGKLFTSTMKERIQTDSPYVPPKGSKDEGCCVIQ